MEDVRNMKEKVQDTVRGLQDLTEEERKDVLSCLTKCLLIEDEELQDLEQRVRARERTGAERGTSQWGGPLTHCQQSALVGLGLSSPVLALGV